MYVHIANKLVKKDPKISLREKNPQSTLAILGTGLDCSRLTKAVINQTNLKYKELLFIVSNNELSRAKLVSSSLIEDLTKSVSVRKRKAKYIRGGVFFVTEVVFFLDMYEKSIDPNYIKRIIVLDRTDIDKNDPLSAAISQLMIKNWVSSSSNNPFFLTFFRKFKY